MEKTYQISARFINGRCKLRFDRYTRGGGFFLRLVDVETEEAICTASVHIPGVRLDPGEVLIKNWSENEGILAALVAAGIVEDTGHTVPTGYVEANICRLLVKPE